MVAEFIESKLYLKQLHFTSTVWKRTYSKHDNQTHDVLQCAFISAQTFIYVFIVKNALAHGTIRSQKYDFRNNP